MKNEQRKRELKARIQAAAKSVFLEKGFAEAKISDIAAAAHISPSTIYLYFSGKEDLFTTLDIPEAADWRPEHERRREEIAMAALTVFGELGFERTTMDDIAERVGFSKAALYQYCTSKEDLFLQVLKYYTTNSTHSPDDTRSDDDDWREYLRVVAKNCLRISRSPERQAFLGTVIRDSNKFPAFGAACYEYTYCAARKNIVRFLSIQQQRGLIRADANIRDCTDVFLGTLMSYMVLYRVISGIECDVDEKTYIDQTVDIFVRALEP